MKRSQVNTYIDCWDGKVALYIVAHAQYQKKRGKHPSEPYKGELNPRKALLLALFELRTYEASIGSHISSCIDRMIFVAKLTNQEVAGTFNGVAIITDPTTSAKVLLEKWNADMEEASRIYRNSDKYKKSQKKLNKKIEMMKEKAITMMQLLKTLDFNNLEAVINWFSEIRDASDNILVNITIPSDEIVKVFESHGYFPDVNCDEEFNGEDKENVARYLIGQALSGLQHIGAIHQVFHHFVKKWRKKFVLGKKKVARPSMSDTTRLF